jgi:hypothetical protein
VDLKERPIRFFKGLWQPTMVDIVDYLLPLAGAIAAFTAADSFLARKGFQSPYYAVHALHNAAIVWSTVGEVATTFTDFAGLADYSPNYGAATAVAALHIYHILMYADKLRFDDWLHHVLMIFVALPVGVLYPSSTLLGFSLFFSTGLPGGIDYALLFGVRNGWLDRGTEKKVNRWLNVWIRAPGCCAHAALTVAYVLGFTEGTISPLMFIPPALMYWNGQYFMQQVVADQERNRVRLD